MATFREWVSTMVESVRSGQILGPESAKVIAEERAAAQAAKTNHAAYHAQIHGKEIDVAASIKRGQITNHSTAHFIEEERQAAAGAKDRITAYNTFAEERMFAEKAKPKQEAYAAAQNNPFREEHEGAKSAKAKHELYAKLLQEEGIKKGGLPKLDVGLEGQNRNEGSRVHTAGKPEQATAKKGGVAI